MLCRNGLHLYVHLAILSSRKYPFRGLIGTTYGRQVPKLATDEAAEAFLDEDLSDLDFAQFKPGQIEFERKNARLTMRVPQLMLDAVKRRANTRGIPYQRFVREAIQRALANS